MRDENRPLPIEQQCDECGAEPGERCRPFCTAEPGAACASAVASLAIPDGRPVRTVPLTTKKHGSTRCVECGKTFVSTPDLPVVEVESTDYAGGRMGVYLARRPVSVRRRWHAVCLARFDASNEAYRDQVSADNAAIIKALAQAAAHDSENPS